MLSIKEEFVFNHSYDELHPLLDRILKLVKSNYSLVGHERLHSNCKLVLMELCTNALKHSNADTTDIHLHISSNCLNIKKMDKGKAFHLSLPDKDNALSFPLAQNLTNKKFIISKDGICCLSATFVDINTIAFSAENIDLESSPSFHDLQEHFGLTIITRAADEFTYSYDPDDHLNIFSATLSI